MSDNAIPVVTCPGHIGHRPQVEVQCGRPIAAFDTVARMSAVEQALRGDDRVRMQPPSADLAVSGLITRVHDPDLVEFLAKAWVQQSGPGDDIELIFADTFAHPGLHAPGTATKRPHQAGAFGRYCFDTITGVGPNTYDAALGSVATAVTAAAHTLQGVPLTLALSRPPGHHVSTDVFGGGCYLNNAAITAQWMRDHGADKVAIVDIDFHHGNGTQAIFYERGDVFYTSLHGHPDRCFPYFTGYADETGYGAGRGTTLNVPLREGIEGPQYLARLESALAATAAQRPDAVIVSLGFDTYRSDPAGDALLNTGDYFAVGQAFGQLGCPVLAILEGGYAVADLGANVRAWVDGAAGTNASYPGAVNGHG
ncbi:histone deacetylase family protein [Mycolicibacterium austroafricanum]|uniref:histone deacetylase family protein n=1 Tax=Mycolicibacterium austroafricanum TaxID=39687 RepID=UPI001CA31678|nr:histone deacetylase family protein [Mycolicibacterium austroafricanum]QZT64261.1 histone deacetylase family protein [Mycolicibacterium austroafricanum]